MTGIRVLICDDSSLVRRGVEAVLGATPGIVLVGVVESGQALVAEVRRLCPDVVLIDPTIRANDALEAIRAVHDECPEANILVITRELDLSQALQAIEAGAVGYLLKDIAPAELVEAVRRVAAGGSMFDPVVARHVVVHRVHRNGHGSDGFKAKGLTPRELEILSVLAHGMADREIATRLYLSEATVKTHLKAIYRKLGVRNRAQAAALAAAHGLHPALPSDGRGPSQDAPRPRLSTGPPTDDPAR